MQLDQLKPGLALRHRRSRRVIFLLEPLPPNGGWTVFEFSDSTRVCPKAHPVTTEHLLKIGVDGQSIYYPLHEEAPKK